MNGITLSVAEPRHGDSIAAIYRPYVETTAITFETEAPDGGTVADQIRARTDQYPWLVAERDRRVLGYAFASQLRTQAAYRWTVELSVYVDREWRGREIGSALYAPLLSILDRQGFQSAYGVVTVPNPESVGFHESFGFDRIALFSEVGYKLGEWHDVAWYERTFGGRGDDPTAPVPFADCKGTAWLSELLASASGG